ncbi:gephyrin-like molybdotransferase Glp [Novosphingobium tardum]|uniref:Molybdopterin molybdenumtransferase n=1 Tax=Novosphingobium tardum TaxID=1538021 RepID=A0ABV8RQ27_9SPHN
MNTLLPVAEARARLLSLAAPLPPENLATAEASGYFLTHHLKSRVTRPEGDTSSMDGFAVRAAEIEGPWRLVGESAAGRPLDRPLGSGEAARISTGALLPQGADAVVIKEDCDCSGDRVELSGSPPSPRTRYVRQAGSDFAIGDTVLEPGTRIGPAQIALALSAGHTHLPVRRPPRIVLIDSGDELCAAGCEPERGQIYASNGPMLAAMLAPLPCEVERVGPLPDSIDALANAIGAASSADIIVTSGGASVGEHDLVRPALENVGAKLDFWRVAVKPGKPLLVATQGKQVILGLPGNPASAYVTAYLFLLPLVRHVLGALDPSPRVIPARLESPLPKAGVRAEYLRAKWDGNTVAPVRTQDSGALAALAAANALIVREPGDASVEPGDTVFIHLLENGAIA